MNILFVLYHDFLSNSATHVCALANELSVMGHECRVAVPSNKDSIRTLGRVRFEALEFGDVREKGVAFSDGRCPDIVHAWTPREVVRQFCQEIRNRCYCHLFVHMEDNEWHLVSSALNKPFEELAVLPCVELDALIPSSLSHPVKAPEFLSSADGITIIIDTLAEIVPEGKPTLELWPSASRDLFATRPKQPFSRAAIGIPRNSTVLVYTGNVHWANADEVRSLYLAVAILNREGHPTTLVRAGLDHCPFLGPDEIWARRHSIELGKVPHTDVPAVLALADVFVQPGRPDNFNDYRFPSKLPEFLSAGRPVILPNTNIAKHMIHRRHAYILPESNGMEIANAVREILSDTTLYNRLTEGALEFFNERLSWTRSANKLVEFYRCAPQST